MTTKQLDTIDIIGASMMKIHLEHRTIKKAELVEVCEAVLTLLRGAFSEEMQKWHEQQDQETRH